LEKHFLRVLRDYTAGDPMRENVRWTNLTQKEMVERLAVAGMPVSVTGVKALLRNPPYVKRKAQKAPAMGQHPDRHAQFENIAQLKQTYLESENPVVSIDTKKKELLGNFYRAGHLHTQEVVNTFDPDFPSAALGVVSPYGVYDLKRNQGHMTLGTSHDTSEFAGDSLGRWWERYGHAAYPQATSLLVLCEGGGSNRAGQYLFKADLQRLANRLRLELRVAHYPPYASQDNPIEPRLFPHITRACQGVSFHSSDLVGALRAKAKTSTGLRVTVDILDKVYQTGRKCADSFRRHMPIVFDAVLPKWNYRAVPSRT
jgi:Rhodopirellula transposase DDE domain